MARQDFTLGDRIDAIESAYEFMLAYAAQGKLGTEGGSCDDVREFLRGAVGALDGFAAACRDATRGDGTGSDGAATAALEDFLRIVEADADKAVAGLRLALVQPAISSQLIDNLNASIHLRTLLTDLFLLDSVVSEETAFLPGAASSVAVMEVSVTGQG